MNCNVSVVIPSYHRPISILSRAVNSIFKQDYPPLEIIVVDDNNDAPQLSDSIQQFCDSQHIRYIYAGGIGAAGARNRGIEAAQGEYIAFLDDDDEWLPEKLAVQLKLFTSPSVGLVYSRGYTVTIQPDGTTRKKLYATDRYYHTEVGYQDLLSKNYIGTTTQIIVRRDILRQLGGFDEALPSRQDYDLCLRVAKEYRCIGADQYLFIHYLHNDGQITASAYNNMLGYKMLRKKYLNDIRAVKGAHCRACYRIARWALKNRSYASFMKYLVLAIAQDPINARKTIKSCFDL